MTIVTPVETPATAFEYLHIERSGGIAGARETVTVNRELNARIEAFLAPVHERALDATEAEELLEAVGKLIAGGTAKPGDAHPDQFVYQIEARWGGSTYTFHVQGSAETDALRGMLVIAAKLLANFSEGPQS
jgi:hypothetical protein